MQKRIAKLYSFLFLTAFAFALALTACSDSNNNNSKPVEPTTAKLDMTVMLPETEVKTLADTKQILVYLLKDQKELDKQLFYNEGDTPYEIADAETETYENHAKSGDTPRYVEFEYETSEVGVPVTIMMEYLGENADDVIATRYCVEADGLKASDVPVEYNSVQDFKPVEVDPKVTCVPTKIETYVGDETKLTVTFKLNDLTEGLDVTKVATYTVNPETLGKVSDGKFVAESVGEGTLKIVYGEVYTSVPVKVSEKPSPEEKYYLEADCNQLTAKENITAVKIGDFATTYDAETGKAITDEKQTVGSFDVTVTVSGEALTTKEPVTFAKPETGEVSSKTLKDDMFVVVHDLVIDYGEVTKFDKKTVEHIVGTVGDELVEFEVDKKTNTATKKDYVFDETGKVSMNFVVTDGKEAPATTTKALDFTVDNPKATMDDGNFPEYIELAVDYDDVPDAQMVAEDVTEVYFDGVKANAPVKNVATLARQTKDMLNKPVSIRFFGEGIKKQAQVEFSEGHLTQYVTNVVDATYDMTVDLTEIVEKQVTRGIAPSFVYLNYDEETETAAYTSEIAVDNKAVVKECAPGQYKVVVVDMNGNTYDSDKVVDVEFTETERTATLNAADFKGDDLTLTLAFDDSLLKEYYGPLCAVGIPQLAYVTVAPETEETLYRVPGGEKCVSNAQYLDKSLTGCEVRLVWKDKDEIIRKELKLAKTVDFELGKAAGNDIEVTIDESYFPTSKMRIIYGNGTDYNAIRIVASNPDNCGINKVSIGDDDYFEFTIDEEATNAKRLVAVMETKFVVPYTDETEFAVQFSQGDEKNPDVKTFECTATGKEIKVVDDEYVLDLTGKTFEDDDGNEQCLYKVNVSGFGSEGTKRTVADIKAITLAGLPDDFQEAGENVDSVWCYWQQQVKTGSTIKLNRASIQAFTNGGLLQNFEEVTLVPVGSTYAMTGNSPMTWNENIVCTHLDINKTAELKRIDASKIKSVWVDESFAIPEGANVYYFAVVANESPIVSFFEQTEDEINALPLGAFEAKPNYQYMRVYTKDDNGATIRAVDGDVESPDPSVGYVMKNKAQLSVPKEVVGNGYRLKSVEYVGVKSGVSSVKANTDVYFYETIYEIPQGMNLEMVVTFDYGTEVVKYKKIVSVDYWSSKQEYPVEVDITDGTWQRCE